MKTLSVGFAMIAVLAVAFWACSPATFEARHETFMPLAPSEFRNVRAEAISLEQAVGRDGIELIAGDSSSQSLQFNCKGVPVLTLINGSEYLSILTYFAADQRAPRVNEFREHLRDRLTPTENRNNQSQPVKPSGIDIFLLKYRDGIDIGRTCQR